MPIQALSYSGRLREDGSIGLPAKMRQKLGLRAGDKVEVVVYPSNGNARSRRPSLRMFRARQKRMDELLFRHREGDLTPNEKRELEALVLEAQLLTVEKAKRSLRQRRK
jgi:AbrB family looped-hinge helix DNA binding protein